MRQQQKNNESKFFSERLRELRGRLTQEEFAKELGIKTQQTYGNYEKGRVPKTPVLQRIAQHCGVTVDWLLGNTTSKTVTVREEIEAQLAGGPAGAAKNMTISELIERIQFHTGILSTDPPHHWPPHVEILSILINELYQKLKPAEIPAALSPRKNARYE